MSKTFVKCHFVISNHKNTFFFFNFFLLLLKSLNRKFQDLAIKLSMTQIYRLYKYLFWKIIVTSDSLHVWV